MSRQRPALTCLSPYRPACDSTRGYATRLISRATGAREAVHDQVLSTLRDQLAVFDMQFRPISTGPGRDASSCIEFYANCAHLRSPSGGPHIMSRTPARLLQVTEVVTVVYLRIMPVTVTSARWCAQSEASLAVTFLAEGLPVNKK